MDFLLGIHHVASIRRTRCHVESPPPPWISFPPDKIPYGKSSPSMGFLPPPPPPSQQKSHMLSQYHICNLCWRRIAIEGAGLPYGIIFPGEVLPWDLFRGGGGEICPIWYYFLPLGKFCHRISSGGGGGVLYGIISPWGSSVIGFLPGGGEVCHYGIIPPCGNSAMRFLLGEGLPYGIPSWGTFAIWYNFRGENLPWYLFPYHEFCVWGGGGDLP